MSNTPITLHPRGSLRAKFASVGDQDGIFRKLGVGARRCDLGDEGLYLAEEIVAADKWLGGSDPEALGILVLALMIAQRQGSSRLPLDDTRARTPSGSVQGSLFGAGGPPGPTGATSTAASGASPTRGRLRTLVTEILRVAGLELDTNRILKRIMQLTATPSFNSVIGTGDARLPLIVEDGCLYTERSRYLEVRVAKRLATRLAAARTGASASDTRAGDKGPASNVISLFRAPAAVAPTSWQPAPDKLRKVMTDLVAREGKGVLSAEQLRAVELALSGSLTVVTGGPGTGKTLVAAAIVRGFARLGVPPIQIALAAQTGKAANRLTEVIGDQLAAVKSPADADRALLASPPTAQTLHRLLGYRGDGFAHHAQSPLPVGAVIVDEASMVDLELMDALLDALPANVPLVLIGDAHQLPAIDAGQILADLAEPNGVGEGCVAVLEHSYRMDAADPRGRAVLEAARAVRASEAQKLTEKNGLATHRSPGTLQWSGAEWVDTTSTPSKALDTVHAVASALWHHFDGPKAQRLANDTVFRFVDGRIDPAQADELDALWRLLGKARLLTVTRGMPTGSLALNAYVHGLTLERMTVTGRPDFVPGEPVMITANDYQRGLFNGDQGIIIRADEGSGAHRYRALFRVQGQLVPFAIEALRDRLELAWALTVHKSQGSELDALALILPEDEHLPLLTRELLYTGITRARTSAVLCGSRAAIVAAGKRGALRHSGLANRLRALR